MMSKIFGTNNTLALYLIPFFGAMIGVFFHFSGAVESAVVLEHQHLTAYFGSFVQTAWLQTVVIIVVLIISAWLITAITAMQDIHEKPNHWSSLLFLLIITMNPAILLWNGFVFANLFLLLALRRILPIYNEAAVNSKVFDAGFLLGVAGFFQPSYWALIILALITLVVMRPFKWREFAILGIGFTTPFYAFVFLMYWQDDFTGLDNLFSMSIYMFDISYLQSQITNGVLYTLLIMSVLMVFSSMRYSTVHQRKHKQTLILLAVISLILNTFFGGVHLSQLGGWLCIPIAVLMPFLIQWFKKESMQNALIFMLVALLILNYLYFPSLAQ
ncbi:MAG: hypothetical protein ACJAUV_001527 [Flavobacteriales bacterium]|jgi:hypothetical protein